MDILFTMEDGSQFLAHYGVKGMKWHQHIMAGKMDAENEENYGVASGVAADTEGSDDPLDRAQNAIAKRMLDNSEHVRERSVSKDYAKDVGLRRYMSVSIRDAAIAAKAHRANKVLRAMLSDISKKKKQRNIRNELRKDFGKTAVNNRRARAKMLHIKD